ncbi:hypothetical protein QYE76_000438 [Lolium multiflorum]|uniref:Ubiquitin-like domain-containing protein n=1 Tax=Lolium multiflorum TaxID=4521 RepID=A0AAD8RJ58_LOLMU|nr:hypothetical protein QYE76_000438 [Lolium multiflorum]
MVAANQAAETIRIYLRPLYRDATLSLDVEGSDTIESVKSKIQSMEGILPEHERLISCGKNLANGGPLCAGPTWSLGVSVARSAPSASVAPVARDARGAPVARGVSFGRLLVGCLVARLAARRCGP